MKIAKKDLALIMVLVGIIAAFCSYNFFFKSKLEEVEAEKVKQADYEAKIAEVQQRASEENKMKSDIQAWGKEISAMVGAFDVRYKYEDGIIYFKNLENTLGIPINTFNIGETNTDIEIPGEGEVFTGKTYSKGSTVYTFTYVAQDYDKLKELINYIVNSNGVKTIDTMSFSISDKEISGSIGVTAYVMNDGTIPYVAPTIEDVDTGKLHNIFQQPEATEEVVPAPAE